MLTRNPSSSHSPHTLLLFVTLFFTSVAPLQGQQLVRAAKSGRLNAVQALLEENPARLDVPDESGYTPLRWAGIRGHGEIATSLLAAGANPNSVGADGGTPLHIRWQRIRHGDDF